MKKLELSKNINNNLIEQDINININTINENNSLSFQEIDILNKNKQNIKKPFNSEKIDIFNYNNNESQNLDKKIHGNIGKNIVLFKRFVLGPKNHLWLLIVIIGAVSISWYLWIYAIGNFYSKILYIFMHILFSLTLFFMILSYLIEPGIIPRNCPDFFKKNEEKNLKQIKKNIEEKNNKLSTPRIFTERECRTCKIIRPSGASHCRICDNCVMDFDHHCIFISNCVGKRNHKYFFLFLLFGSVFSILSILFNLIVIIYVFIIKGNETIFYIYKGNKFIFFLSLILLVISFIYSTSRHPDYGLIIIPGVISIGLFLYLWFKYFPKNKNTPSYYNPFIIIVFIISIIFAIFNDINLCSQCYHIERGLTIKQIISIKDKIVDLSLNQSKLRIKNQYFRQLSFEEKFKNIIYFLFKRMDKSLIIPKRDLIN